MDGRKRMKVIGLVAAMACLVAGAAILTGCTDQQRAKSFGGTATIELEQGKKLVVVTWKGEDLWLMTRDWRDGDRAETYKFAESSSWGFMEGTVVIKEKAPPRIERCPVD